MPETTDVCPLNREERCEAYPITRAGEFHRMACVAADCPLTIKAATPETTLDGLARMKEQP
jgi:hypothetical protein